MLPSKLFITTLVFAFFLVSCGGTTVTSPLSRSEKRIYRIDKVEVKVASSVPLNNVKREIENNLGTAWKYWLFGYRPLDITVEVHDVNVSSSWLQRLFGTRMSMTTRIIIIDQESGGVLDDFTRVTNTGYRGLSIDEGGQSAQLSNLKELTKLFVDEFRLMFYFGLE